MGHSGKLEAQLETAAANVADALRIQQEAAWEEAIRVDGAREPEAIAATLDDAADAVARSDSAAAAVKADSSALAKPLLNRAHGCHCRIAGLRHRLSILSHRTGRANK